MEDRVPDLTLIAGPIGNLADLSPRAADGLRRASLWIVEDSRVSAKLAALLEVKKRMAVVNDHTPATKLKALVERIAAGEDAALLTDAGTPSVSDPGAELAALCIEAGLVVDAVPGPSAVTTALMVSGFFAQRFCFLGFLGKKPGAMRKELEPYCDSTLTLVLFESPHRIDSLINAAGEALGSRRYAACRELTKRHQQVFRGVLPYVPTQKEMPHKGEFTLVIEGKRRNRDHLV